MLLLDILLFSSLLCVVISVFFPFGDILSCSFELVFFSVLFLVSDPDPDLSEKESEKEFLC